MINNKLKIPCFIVCVLLLSEIYSSEIKVNRPSNVSEEADYNSKYQIWSQRTAIVHREWWHPEGVLALEAPLKDGQFHGKFSWYDRDGTKFADYTFKHGVRIQLFNYTMRYPKIQKPSNLSEAIYWSKKYKKWIENDTFLGLITMYYINGEKYKFGKGIIDNDEIKFTSLVKEWYQTGEIKKKLLYNAEGRLHGKLLIYEKNGKVIKKLFYNNGKL